jgi:aryl-alcohol dehydrogenase-like predicted oxidoreductase
MFTREVVETELVDVADQYGVGLVAWSPLASGILTGKYNDGIPTGSRLDSQEWLRRSRTPERIEKVRQLSLVAKELGSSVAQLALAWLLRLPEMSSVITGASRVSQVHENLQAAQLKDKLTPDVLERIEAILGNDPNAQD